jgi:flavin-dependent dehydrogenase
MYDIAIIGAGPAGATLARLIGKHYRVLLVDKRPLGKSGPAEGADKCCGGLLAPDAQRMLSKFGLGLPITVLEEPQLFSVKAIDLNRGLERFYQRHYINIDRGRFDEWLVSLVPGTVDVRTGWRVVSDQPAQDGFCIRLQQKGRQREERARLVVAADGATSFHRGQSIKRPAGITRYIAIQEWVESTRQPPHFTSVFDTEITDFYCWTIPKGQHLIVGAALRPCKDSGKKFSRYKSKLRQYGFEFGKPVKREGALIIRPLGAGQLRTAGMGRAFIGEAGGWISPSSAEGLSYAFRSALCLAESVSVGLSGFEKRYAAAMQKLRRNILVKRLKSRILFNPVLRAAVMRSGLQALRICSGDHAR